MSFIYQRQKQHLFFNAMRKVFTNPLYNGIAIAVILVLVVAWMYDSYKNNKKDFYGLLPAAITTTPAAI